MVSVEGLRYFRHLHESPAFGASGGFDLDALRKIMGSRREPDDSSIRCIPSQIDNIPCEWVMAPGSDPGICLLYLHGGGFVSGAGAYYLALAARLSTAARCMVLLPDYRLAPEHPFPAALEDCVTAYRWLLKQDFSSRNMVMAGDSAGGNLTITTIMQLRDRGDALPVAAACLRYPSATR